MTDLSRIMEHEAKLKADVSNPNVTEIDLPPAFFREQIGLRTIMADPIGRIWDVSANPIKMIFDPLSVTQQIKRIFTDAK